MDGSVESYETFPVDKLKDNSVTDFDVFMELKQHFILYGASGYRWEKRELNDLLGAGHQFFYVKPEDSVNAKTYFELCKLPEIDKNLAPRERIVEIEQVGKDFTKCLYEGEITPGCVSKAETLVGSMIDCVREDTGCIQALSGLADRDYYTYYHSVRVSTYATAIALKMGITDQSELSQIALGGIFHDIGKKDIPIGVINKADPLTQEEWDLMRSHPSKGFDALEESLLSHVPREIIKHHHEKLNGAGYPDGLTKDSLLIEVQIATLADIFDALTSSRSYQNKRTRYEALDLIKHRFLGEEINQEAFHALIACLIE